VNTANQKVDQIALQETVLGRASQECQHLANNDCLRSRFMEKRLVLGVVELDDPSALHVPSKACALLLLEGATKPFIPE
jgi:hypothetical protein